jgi:hypothetical protein
MKKLKYITIFTVTLTIALVVYKYKTEEKDIQKSSWQTYEKVGPKITTHGSTEQEMRKSRVNTSKKRTPASISKIKKGRTMTGSLHKEYDKAKASFLNKPADDWKEKFVKSKFVVFGDETKILIKHKDSIIQVNKKGAMYLEKVVVSIQRDNEPPMSYEALINSETGQQIKSWNRTKHENVKKVLFTKKL